MKIKHDIREYQCVSCNATFTGYREDCMTVYSTVENEHRPERLHVSGCPACGCDDCMEVEPDEVDDGDDGYGDDLEVITNHYSNGAVLTVNGKVISYAVIGERTVYTGMMIYPEYREHILTFANLFPTYRRLAIVDGVAVEAVGVGTKSKGSAGTLSTPQTPSTPSTPSPRYYEVVIQPCASGFGEWAPSEANGEGWDDVDNLESEIRSSVDVIEWATLENTDADIRGRIHRQNELLRLFAWRDDDGALHYSGIVEG